ncbi:hypothetical protein K7432_007633 [Basidiobolus ranarum]|uniref:C2H2-type domain-containing protein n=1 Tax=Basidiobolus ranarum TaxID=34480 RepID=A0ABR2WT45_9FUNG
MNKLIDMTDSRTNPHNTYPPFHFRNHLSYSHDSETTTDFHFSEVSPATPVANSSPIDSVSDFVFFPQVYFPTDLPFESQFVADNLDSVTCNADFTPPDLNSTLTPELISFFSSNPVTAQIHDIPVDFSQEVSEGCFNQPIDLNLPSVSSNTQTPSTTDPSSLEFSTTLTEDNFLLPWSFETIPESDVTLPVTLSTTNPEEDRIVTTETRGNSFTPYILSNPIPEYTEYSSVTFTAPTKLLDNSQLVYPCTHPNCKKTFTSLNTLQSHYRIHSPERPFRCHLCYKYFNTAHDLRRHLKTHLDLKPYRCCKCSRSFGRLDAMKRHRSNCRYASPKERTAQSSMDSSTTEGDETT